MTIAARAAKVGVMMILILVGGGSAIAKQIVDSQVKIGPKPNYPMIATWLGLEGYCEVRLTVDENRLPFAITPSCTRPIFCFEAKRAVSATLFEPKTIDGVPTVRPNVVFPLEFFFPGSGYHNEEDPRPLELCEQKPVA